MPDVTLLAAMLFVNRQGELLLQLRDDKPEIRFPNHWGVIGGHVEAGETDEEAVVREAYEEVERRLTQFERWGDHVSPGYHIAVFAARLDTPASEIVLHEGQRVEFQSPQAAMVMPLVPWLLEVIPQFVRSGLYRRLAPRALPVPNLEAASVVFVNRRGELLLRLRSDLPDLPFPAMWDLIGGAMEDGESAAEAAVRETQEEIGLDLADYAYWDDVRGVVLIHVFAAPLDVPAESLLLTEGERLAWYAPDAALALPLVPYMRKLVPNFAASAIYKRLATGA
jgi:8-oxo-dGTP diphosphatase